jgi:hypothetical protein
MLLKRSSVAVGVNGGSRWMFVTTAPLARLLDALERLDYPVANAAAAEAHEGIEK